MTIGGLRHAEHDSDGVTSSPVPHVFLHHPFAVTTHHGSVRPHVFQQRSPDSLRQRLDHWWNRLLSCS